MKATTPYAIMVETMLAADVAASDIVAAVEAMERSKGGKSKQLSLLGDNPDQLARGARLSETWTPTAADVAYARQRGLTDARIATESERFKNYWTSKTGANARKTNWGRVWQNWIINVEERYGRSSNNRSGHGAPAAPGRAAAGADAILAGMGRVAARISQNRTATGQQRQIPPGPDIAGGDDAERGTAR